MRLLCQAGAGALLLLCLGCGGRPSLPPPEAGVASFNEDAWFEHALKGADESIDLLEAVAVLSADPNRRSQAADDIRAFLEPSMRQAKARLAATTDPEQRIRVLNEALLPRIEQGLSGQLRLVHERLGADDGNCVPLSLLYAQAASEMGLGLQIAVPPSHALVRWVGPDRVRNIETTAGGLSVTNTQLRDAIQARFRDKSSFPEAPEDLEKCFTPVTRRQCIALLYCQRAAGHLERGDKVSAQADYDTALRISPEWHLPHYRMGMFKGQAFGDFKAAHAELSSAIEKAPYLPQPLYNRGVSNEELRDATAAIADYEAAGRLAPHHPLFVHAVGSVQVALGKYAEAVAAFTRALELDPNYERSRHNRAQVWEHHLRDYRRAIEDYSLLLEKNPKHEDYWDNRGCCYMNLRKFVAALSDLDKAVELDPRQGSFRRNRAATLANSGKLREALSDFDQAIALDAKDRKTYEMRARVRQLLGDAEGQRQDLEKAASLPKED